MFLPVKSDTGAVLPWEYLEAGAETYQAGQLLAISDGKLAKVTTLTEVPAYLCMANKTVAAEDEGTTNALLPVTRIQEGAIYETTLSAAAEGAKPGVKAQIAEGGLETDGTEGGAFELVQVFGTAKGDTVRGRWVHTAAAGE